MKPNNALTYVRQLCCLGLGKEAVIPELLRSVKAVIPSDSNVFIGLDENQFPAYAIPEYFVPEALEVYTTETERLHSPELMLRIFNWFDRCHHRTSRTYGAFCHAATQRLSTLRNPKGRLPNARPKA